MPLKPEADYSKTKTYLIAKGKHQSITTAEILTTARSLISKPENWTQAAFARDKRGMMVHVYSDTATCFCSVGAVDRVIYELELNPTKRDTLLCNYFNPFLHTSLTHFNDFNPHNSVIELFDKAIAKAELSKLD